MGFVRDKTFLLDLAGSDAAGLTVRCRSVPIGAYMEAMELIGDGVPLRSANRERIDRVIDIVGGSIVEWDLQDHEGEQVSADAGGLASQDKDLVLAVVNAWIDAQAGVTGPLDQPSTGGDRSLEASLPMEPLSPSPAS